MRGGDNEMTYRNVWKVPPVALSVAILALAQVSTNVPRPCRAQSRWLRSASRFTARRWKAISKATSVDRDVIVFLPPSYATQKNRRYPVVYALHGYSIGAEQWTKEIHVPQTIEGAFAQGRAGHDCGAARFQDRTQRLHVLEFRHHRRLRELSSRTMSSPISTPTTAPFPKRTSRGLAGHSMGGYGASRIGMKHPDVFGSLYIMSPCCMSAQAAPASATQRLRRRWRRSRRRRIRRSCPSVCALSWLRRAAWSPDPKNPPLYLDLPTQERRRQSGRAGEVGRERSAGLHRSIHREPAPVSGDFDRRRRPGRPKSGRFGSCTKSWTATGSPTPLRSTRARTPAPLPTAFRIM